MACTGLEILGNCVRANN